MSLLDIIGRKNILVIGDVMLDTYFTGEVQRISPEAPVPVFRKVRERSVPGGAANVAVNLVAAGQNVSLLSLIGNDSAGRKLRGQLEKANINCEMLITGKQNTVQKIRFIAENNQQVMRLDEEDTGELESDDYCHLMDLLHKKINHFSVLILSDYLKGLLSPEFTQRILRLAKEHGIRVLADVKDSRAKKYKGAYLLKPNLSELRMMTDLPVETKEEIITAAYRLRDICQCAYVLVTMGSRGMLLAGSESPLLIKADDHEVFDVTGAGDTALAYLAASLANELQLGQAVEIANHAAGLQVTKMGTSAISLYEVNRELSHIFYGTAGKILDQEMASELRESEPEKKIVFTNGCFDILHIGHVRSLEQAAKLGDLLVIGLNSDASVRHLKGENRPINSAKDRAELLASLEYVDYVIIFEEDTPYELIRQIRPDVIVKGKDYKLEEVVGKDIVEAYGGKVVLVDLVEGKSTTGILQKM